MRVSGAKCSRDPLVSALLGESVASSPLAEVRRVDGTNVGYPSFVCTKQMEVVKPMNAHDYPPPSASGRIPPLHLWA